MSPTWLCIFSVWARWNYPPSLPSVFIGSIQSVFLNPAPNRVVAGSSGSYAKKEVHGVSVMSRSCCPKSAVTFHRFILQLHVVGGCAWSLSSTPPFGVPACHGIVTRPQLCVQVQGHRACVTVSKYRDDANKRSSIVRRVRGAPGVGRPPGSVFWVGVSRPLRVGWTLDRCGFCSEKMHQRVWPNFSNFKLGTWYYDFGTIKKKTSPHLM